MLLDFIDAAYRQSAFDILLCTIFAIDMWGFRWSDPASSDQQSAKQRAGRGLSECLICSEGREPSLWSGLGPSFVDGSAANEMLQGQLRQQRLLFGQLWKCVLSSLVTLPCLHYAKVKVFHFRLHLRSESVRHRRQVNQKSDLS